MVFVLKVYYESLESPLIDEFVNAQIINNVLELEEDIKSINNIEIQLQNKIKKIINNSDSDITLLNLVKSILIHSRFNTGVLRLDYNIPYIIRIKVKNVRNDGIDLEIYLNNSLIEEVNYTDYYTFQNNKSIQAYSTKLMCNIEITLGNFLYPGEYVDYEITFLKPEVDYSYDEFRNNIIFHRRIGEYVGYICRYFGHIFRAKTINSILFKDKQFLLIENNSNYIKLLQPLIFPNGKIIYYIKPQDLRIDMHGIEVGYNYIGIYVDFSDLKLKQKVLDSDVNYNALTNRIQIARADDTYQWLAFGIAENRINSLNQYDIIYLSAGGGLGGGGLNKLIVDFTSSDVLTVNYTGGQQPPFVEVYDDEGNVIMPQRIHYDYANTITIEFGEVLSGKLLVV